MHLLPLDYCEVKYILCAKKGMNYTEAKIVLGGNRISLKCWVINKTHIIHIKKTINCQQMVAKRINPIFSPLSFMSFCHELNETKNILHANKSA